MSAEARRTEYNCLLIRTAKVKSELGLKDSRREVIEGGGTYVLREQSEAYVPNLAGENEALSSEH